MRSFKVFYSTVSRVTGEGEIGNDGKAGNMMLRLQGREYGVSLKISYSNFV